VKQVEKIRQKIKQVQVEVEEKQKILQVEDKAEE